VLSILSCTIKNFRPGTGGGLAMRMRVAVALVACWCFLSTMGCKMGSAYKFDPPKSSYKLSSRHLSGLAGGAAAGVLVITPAFFLEARLAPAIGRMFIPEEYRSRSKVALLGDAFWKKQFKSDPAVIGRSVEIDDVKYTIIGVMPRTFDFPSGADLCVPAANLN
ncbi:MAG: ABC transporter permease, partial [Blastocatellia bacterium]